MKWWSEGKDLQMPSEGRTDPLQGPRLLTEPWGTGGDTAWPGRARGASEPCEDETLRSLVWSQSLGRGWTRNCLESLQSGLFSDSSIPYSSRQELQWWFWKTTTEGIPGLLRGAGRAGQAEKAARAQPALLGRALVWQNQLPSRSLSENWRSEGKWKAKACSSCALQFSGSLCWEDTSRQGPDPTGSHGKQGHKLGVPEELSHHWLLPPCSAAPQHWKTF